MPNPPNNQKPKPSFNPPKGLFLTVSILGLMMGVLPELISDEMKMSVRGRLGAYYDATWLAVFLGTGAVFIWLTWRQNKREGTTGRVLVNKAKIKGNKNKVLQGTGSNPNTTIEKNTFEIEGDENEFQQGQNNPKPS